MSVRITGGVARGRVLREPVSQGVRPTSARVREALFSMLGQDLTGQTFLDAFGGAGIVGLEAWSRGARVTVFEKDRRAFKGIVARGKGLGADWEVRCDDVLKRAPDLAPFDVVFADPPYGTEPEAVLAALAPLARRRLVVEVDVRTDLPERAGPHVLERKRRHGHTVLAVYGPSSGR